MLPFCMLVLPAVGGSAALSSLHLSACRATPGCRPSASGAMRLTCDRCSRPLSVCVCRALPAEPIDTATQVLVLQHPAEVSSSHRIVIPLNGLRAAHAPHAAPPCTAGEAANLIRSADATLRAQCRGRLRDQLQPPQPTTPADRHRRWTRPSSAFSWSRSRRSAAAAGATARRRRRGRPWPQRGLASDGLRGRAAACARGRHVGPGAAHASALA
mmetsp:Transcript_32181/g.102577  ORF Transcript_32181/g.102577 Transcript_32181/m.102577 type:complete len:214 (-) Transcript_32181:591-1232(-)|eukprot:scaffold19466_cov129-Isochrysis_galbana.AAC.1